MESANSPHSIQPIVCRADNGAWIPFAFFAIMILGLLATLWIVDRKSPPSQQIAGLADVIGGFILVFAACACAMLYTRIEAAERGLRWRRLGGWKSATWSEIQDFYLLEPQKGQRIHVVETTAGKLRISTLYRGVEAMARAIADRATNAGDGEWKQLGCRAGGAPPCRFSYSVGQKRGMLAFFTVLGICLPVLMLSKPISTFHTTAQTIGIGWAIGSVAMGLVVIWFHCACCVLLVSTAWRALKDAGQQIETNETGIVFWDGAQRVEAKWDQVIQYGVPRETIKSTFNSRFQVRADAGDFAFTPYLHNSTLLMQIIRHWSPKSAGDAEKREYQETLGGEAALWTGSYRGVGERVFHYKTRTNRAFLVFLTSFAIIPLAAPLTERAFGLPPPPPGSDLDSVVTALFAGALWASWRYHSARIVMSDRGLTERSAFGVRQLA